MALSVARTEPITFRSGWLPTPDNLKVELTPHLRAIALPSSADRYSGVPFWGMLANDQLGDCTCAADGHILCQQTALGDGNEVRPTDAQTITVYEASGYVPGDPSTDNGWTVQAALEYLRTRGWPGNGWKITAYGTVDVSNHNAIKQAVYEFGCLSIGFSVPQSAMDQFNAGQPWVPVANDGGIVGGHCVTIVGYDLDWLYLVTWGTVWRMSWSFWDRYVSEAHAVITRDWVSKSGLNLQAFGQEFVAMFGGTNPFANGPTPTPPPPAPQPSGCLPNWLGRLLAR